MFIDKMTSLGNKLLVYLSCCLSGVAYPIGLLNPETSLSVKDQVIFLIFKSSIDLIKLFLDVYSFSDSFYD